MFAWLFGKNYDNEIADMNRIIGDLQDKIVDLERQLEDVNIEGEVEDAINNVDMEDMARNAIEEAFAGATLRFR